MVDMNNYGLWVKGYRCYEQFRDVDDMNDFIWWAQGSRWYEQLKVMDDMNHLESCELRPLDGMNIIALRVIWMILGHEEKAPNVMNNSRLWMTWMTQGHELRALDAINNSRLWMTWMTLARELRTINAMSSSGIWMITTLREYWACAKVSGGFDLWVRL